MTAEAAQILWDCSQLWGIMAWRALRSLGAPCGLISAKQIAQGALFRKPQAILLVPGGSARLKAAALGREGMAAIRAWVDAGGRYLGFCGGAGLALAQTGAGLGLCPWQRRAYPERLAHLITGTLIAQTSAGKMPLPVWWPGCFEPGGGAIEALARHLGPGPDLWLADLPLAEAPKSALAEWRAKSGADPLQIFPDGQPLAIKGRFGKGEYILSYAHLETPQATAANAWLASLLEAWGLPVNNGGVDAWEIKPKALPRAHVGQRPACAAMANSLHGLLRGAAKLGFFFQRSPWLWGWRRGAPGIACNHLLACLDLLADLEPTAGAADLWEREGQQFTANFERFLRDAEAYFWSARLERTLGAPSSASRAQGEAVRIFGHPMTGGGMADGLLRFLEAAIFAALAVPG